MNKSEKELSCAKKKPLSGFVSQFYLHNLRNQISPKMSHLKEGDYG